MSIDLKAVGFELRWSFRITAHSSIEFDPAGTD